MPTLYIRKPYFTNKYIVIIIKAIEINISIIPIWPNTNKEGAKIDDINGINESILINNDPLNIPAIIDK